MEIFKSVDIDGNGRIEKNELQIAFSKTLGREASEVEVENMFKAVDMNDDGKISFDEYFTIIHVTLNADKEMQKLIDAFEVSHIQINYWLDFWLAEEHHVGWTAPPDFRGRFCPSWSDDFPGIVPKSRLFMTRKSLCDSPKPQSGRFIFIQLFKFHNIYQFRFLMRLKLIK